MPKFWSHVGCSLGITHDSHTNHGQATATFDSFSCHGMQLAEAVAVSTWIRFCSFLVTVLFPLHLMLNDSVDIQRYLFPAFKLQCKIQFVSIPNLSRCSVKGGWPVFNDTRYGTMVKYLTNFQITFTSFLSRCCERREVAYNKYLMSSVNCFPHLLLSASCWNSFVVIILRNTI